MITHQHYQLFAEKVYKTIIHSPIVLKNNQNIYRQKNSAKFTEYKNNYDHIAHLKNYNKNKW